MRRAFFFCVLLAASLFAASCGLLENIAKEPEPDKPNGPQPASSIADAKKATVYIEASGGLYDTGREFGEISYGSGSGFIIDPSGLAVTNNHVVTGSSTLDVYVEGQEEPLGAEILGVSECSDLAVVDIEGGGYEDFLSWREGPIESSLHVNALGYPSDDLAADEKPDQTFSEGVVGSVEGEGDVAWASVGSVLEHAAQIRPGNSGGPLIDDKGRVVGVNFAGGGGESQRYYAISRDEARGVVGQLQNGDVDSLGINGEADGDLGGIAVVSVETGSPAFDAGIRGAEVGENNALEVDVLKELEGTKLAENSTMQQYCDILRQRGADDEMTLEVERYAFDGETITDLAVLEGVVNGEPLKEDEAATAERFPEDTAASAEPAADPAAGEPASGGFVEIQDQTGALAVEVPAGWSDTANGEWDQEGERLGLQVSASPDLAAYNAGWYTPGVFFGASRVLKQRFPNDSADQVLDLFGSDDCEYNGREAYDDGTYKGKFDSWINCGDADSSFQIVAALPADGSYVLLVQMILMDEEDLKAQEQIIRTFRVVGEVR